MPNETPTLEELPEPPFGKTGWPWTEPNETASEIKAKGTEYPKISIVTPSYNQGQFIEETIRSVLLQGYPNLEYFVVDGGSTDETIEILNKYDPWIDNWISEPDRGQSHAINKGFEKCSGQLATFINSDDMLEPSALLRHAQLTEYTPETIYVGDCRVVDAAGNTIKEHTSQVRSFEDLVDIPNVWRRQPIQGHIIQMEVLFSLDLYHEVGGLNENLKYTMDYDLWGKLLLAGAKIEYTGVDIGIFRRHEDQKTADGWVQTEALCSTARSLVRRQDEWDLEKKKKYIEKINQYEERTWRSTGRLARLPIPRLIVRKLREWKAAVA